MGKKGKYKLTEKQKKWLDKCIGWAPCYSMRGGQLKTTSRYEWDFNEDSGEVTIWGSFDCSGQGLTDFKGITFAYVSGDFNCSKNSLTNLDCAPRKVDGDFNCSYNQISRIEGNYEIGGTRHGFGWFDCSHNKLETISKASFYGLDFDFSHNLLPNLKGADITLHVSYSDGDDGDGVGVGPHYYVNSTIYLNNNKIKPFKTLPKGIKYGARISYVSQSRLRKPNVVLGYAVVGQFGVPVYLR